MSTDVVFLGQKHFQQCAVVRRMAIDLNPPIEIVAVPTVREPDGLAMSSRNRYLSEEQRRRVIAISRGLFAAADRFCSGERNVEKLVAVAKGHLETVDRLEYLELIDPCSSSDNLRPIRHFEKGGSGSSGVTV
jgi:pantoate--beta-alanine ligase